MRAMAKTESGTPAQRYTWSLSSAGNRALYSFAAAVLANLALHSWTLALLIAFVLFLLLTAVAVIGRRS